ncbi:conserved hypothetical protein [Talaromyces stipitatus ATCC 10500]|uniref:Uncharacterized protein n=1 Tax=Talaromyces stipitatus (strain ATCC 10500 / CBS 375.48 / QM 6759 / NRRL 1006) TaxID=441959 RepID=B8MCY9_TALSN|nr:uncharacterized protein TSTA_113410 [Talaromyces stipitatus ATCC 10500]EED17515.1 conserved hypothetical protein [Talaromyces stipitatus ATCC 10500]
MFRRRSSSRHQPLNTTPSESAQTAASRAYIANRDANLSSAAAAAALRSHTTPPTSPGNVQTKRMLQRQLSNSSRGSAAGLRHGSQPTLRRTPSSGSMTSRTFRDPSPGRSSTSGAASHHPPVPPIPQSLPSHSMPSQRSASVQPTRGTASPLRRLVTGRGASLDRGPSSMTASPTTPRNVSQGSSLELDRPGSRTSINFSYPMNARANSPPQSPVECEFPRNSGEKSPSPPSISPVEAAGIQQSINNTANRKVKLKPRTAAPGSKERSHFAHKTMGGRPTGTAIQDEVENDGQESHESASPQSSGVSTADFAPGHSVPVPEDRTSLASEKGDIAHIARPQPKKRPSMVMEDHEGEELAEAAHAAQEAVPEPPAVSKPQPQTESTTIQKPMREALVIYPPNAIQTNVSPHTRPSPSTSSTPSSPSDRLLVDNTVCILPQRQSSTSPNRSARFSTQLTVGSESPLHEPPPRSTSPAKPALKNSSSPDRRVHLGQTPSEFSDATSVASDDGSRAGSKRRVAKVSFDDEAEVVGVAASPPTSPEPMNRAQSPVEKVKPRKWFGIGKKKTTSKDVAEDDDFESVLRPRPALPSFGSIRGMRESEEAAALVMDEIDSDSSSDGDFDARNSGVSSDHAIGAILRNAQERTNQTQQHPTDETSVPDLGSKEHPSEVLDEVEPVKGTGGVHHLPTVQEEQSSTTPSEAGGPLSAQNTEVVPKEDNIIEQQVDELKETVPSIAIQPATPGEEPRNSIDLRNMPGGFPTYISERVAASEGSQQTPVDPKTANPPAEEADSDGESGESIYSDAAEDPLEFQGDVFGSINAIVDSPLPPQAQLPKEAPESPTRTLMHPDPLANISEPIPSPSLEAINPRMPATPSGPTQVPNPASPLETVEEHQKQRSDPAESSWPLKDDATSPAAGVQQKPKTQSLDPHHGSHLRKSLGISDGQHEPRQSLRSTSGPASSAATKPRRTQTSSATQITDNSPKKRAGKALPHSMTFPASATKVTADDSDSDSSFKRTRRSSRVGPSGQYTMKRTMRAGRPMSMADSDTLVERTTSPPRASSMRTTLRGPASERSSGFSSLRDKPGRPRPRGSVLSSSTRSRIGDSDDEGRGARRLFQSRFADSSDEDEPTSSNLTPVRGIPRRKGGYDGDSTDLDDSSDEETKTDVRNGTNKLVAQMTPEEVEAILSQPKKKGGLFSRLRSPTRGSGKDGKVRKSLIESPARRDTPLERSRHELARMREETASPKLQKRHRAASAFAETWPLNAEQASTLAGSAAHSTQNRPSTSDGIPNDKNNNRPVFSRHGTSDSVDSRVTSAASEVVIGRSGKKKRFPLLRRAFGLRD